MNNDDSRLNFTCIRHREAPVQKEDTISRQEAKDRGYKVYWNGSPCEHGHVSVRYTSSGRCRECYKLFRADEINFSEISKDPLKRGRKRRSEKTR